MSIKFIIKAQDHQARLGLLKTFHGDIQTPTFMPVGTSATVKAMLPESLKETNAEIILGNTYHLMLRPGEDIVNEMGGLHSFMSWDRPILTDSGGFQIMSLSPLRKISQDGVEFRSHIDGKSFFLTPKRSIDIQNKLDSNITMILDECVAADITYEYANKSLELSNLWAQKSKEAFIDRNGYGLFGIVQGGMFKELREKSAKHLMGIGFDGYAIGSLAVGETQEKMLEILSFTAPMLPEDKPRYLMGVGKPLDIIKAVKLGVDMFDCVIPTRSGRNGQAFVNSGVINIRNEKFIRDPRPLEEKCNCYVCLNYSRSYLSHLVRNKEILGAVLMTWHNIAFYQNMMKKLRSLIAAGSLYSYKDEEILSMISC